MFRAQMNRASMFCSLLAIIVSTFATNAYGQLSGGQSSLTFSGRMSVRIELRDISSKKSPTYFDATIPFNGSRVTFSITGLTPGIYNPQIKSVRGFASVAFDASTSSQKFALTNKGPGANVFLGSDDRPRLMGPQSNVDVILDITLPLVPMY